MQIEDLRLQISVLHVPKSFKPSQLCQSPRFSATVVKIECEFALIFIKHVLTHAEYDKGDWKK